MDGGVVLHPAHDADAAQVEARRLAARVQELEEDLRFSRERHSLVEQQVETLLAQLSSSTGAQRRLAGEAGRLKAEADSLRWQLESAQRAHTTQNEQYEEEVKALRSQRDGLSREKVLVEADCRNRQQTIRQLQRDVESLKGQVQAAAMQADEKADLLFRALADKDEITMKCKSACEKRKELDLQLKTQAEEYAKEIRQALEASKEAWAAADAEVEAKQALLEELRNEHAASMERMANEYAQEITRLREQLRQEKEERAKMEADNALLEPRNYSPAVRAFLQDPRNADYNRMLAEVQDLKDLVKDERTARAEAEKELKRERHSLEEARRHGAGRERKAEEMQTMADQYIVRSTHLARELKNMQEALRVVEKDKEELSRENKRLTREVNQFSRQVQFLLFDEYRRARALTRGWGEPGETDIRILVFSDVQQLQAQNANLLAQLHEAEEPRDGWHREQQERAEVYGEYDQRLQRMENARGEMQGMLAEVAAENRSLRAQLEASTQEATSRAIVPSVPQLPPPQHDVSTAIVPSGSSSADAGQLTRAVGRIASLEQELEEAKTMVQAAFQQLDETQTKLNQMAGGKVAAETDCQFWKDRCEDANRRADNHQKSIASYEDRLREAKEEALDAKSKADEAVSQTRRLSLDLDQTRSELQRVRSEYENAQGSVYRLREEVAGLRAELKIADKEASDAKGKGRELERRMDIERQHYETQLKAAEQRLTVVKQEMEKQRVALEVKIQSAHVQLGQVLDSTEQAAELRREKLELQTRLSAAERYAKDGQHKLTELQQQYTELQSRYEESAELQRRLDQADEDRKTLVTELEAMRAELSTAAAQKDEAMSARAVLEGQLASFHQRASASKDQTLKKLQNLKVRAAEGGAPSSSAPAGEVDGRVEQKQEQDDAHLQVASLQSQVAQLTATVAELQGRNLQFLQEMQGGQETDNTYQARLSSLERRLASVTVELQDRDAEVKVLTERLRIAVHEAKDKQTGSTHESRDLKERLEQQSQELEGLRRANAILRDEATHRQEDSSRAGPSAPSTGPLSAYSETSIHPTQDELQRERTARQEAERREKHAREQLEAMALQVQQLRVEASRAGQNVRTELRGQLSQAQAALASVQQEYHRLAGQLTLEAPDAVRALTADVQALETDNRAHRATIEDLQRQLDDQNRLRSMLDSEDRVDRRLYMDLKEKHDDAVSQLQAAKRELEDIRAQLETARTDEQAARRELEIVRSELETLEAKHEKALSDHHQKEEAAKRVNKTKNQLSKAKADLESRLEQAEKRVSELEGELAKAQNDARQARDRAAKAQTDLNEMKKQLNSAQPQKGQPGADQQALQQEIEKLKHQLQCAQQQRTAPAIEIQRLQQQVAQLTAQNESQLRQLQQVPPSVAEQQKLQQELEKEKVRAEKLMKQNEWALETIKVLQAQVAARQQPRRNTGRAPKGPPAHQQAGGRGGGQAAPATGQPRPPARTPSPQSSARPAARPVGSTATCSVPATGAVVADAARSGAQPTIPSSTPTQPSPSAVGAQARREAPSGATSGAGGSRVGGGPASRPTDGPTARPSKPVVTSATQQAAPQTAATGSQRPAATPPEPSVPIPPHEPQTTATAVACTVVAAVSAPAAPQSLPQAGSRTVSQPPRVTAARSQVHTRPQPDKVGVKRPASSATQAVTQSATGEPSSQQPEAPEPKRVKTEPPVAPIPTPATAVAPPAPQPEEARVATGMEESEPEDVRTMRVLAAAPSTVTAGDEDGSAMMVADDEEQAQQQPAPTSATIGMQEQAGEEAGEQRITEAEAADEAVSMEEDQPTELTPEEAAEAPQSPAAAVLAPHAVESVATEEPSEGAGAQAAEVTEPAMEMAPTTEAKGLQAGSQEQREGEMQAEEEGEREGEAEPVVEEPDTEMQPQAAQGTEAVEERQEDQVEEEGTAEGEEGLASEKAETMEEGAVQAASGVVEMTEAVEGLEGEDGQTEAVGEGHEEQEGARMQEGQEQEGEGESASSEPRLPSAVEKSADDEHIEHDEEGDNVMEEGDAQEDGQERQDVPENREEEGNEEEGRAPPEATDPDAAAEEASTSAAEARTEELSREEEADVEDVHMEGDEGEEGDETGAQATDEMEAPETGAEVEASTPGPNQQADSAAVEDEAARAGCEMPVVEAPGEGEVEMEQGEEGLGREGDESAVREGAEEGHEGEEVNESAVREAEEEGLEREEEDESAVREGEPAEEQLEGEKEGVEQTQENEGEDVGQGSTQANAEDGDEDEKGGTQVEQEDGNEDVTGERGMEPPDDVYTELPAEDPSASNEGAANSTSLSAALGAPLTRQTPAAGATATMSASSSVAPPGGGKDEGQTQGEHTRPEQVTSTLEARVAGDEADHGLDAEADVPEEGLEDQQEAEQGDGTEEGDDRMDEDDKDAGHDAGPEDSAMMEE